MTARRLCVQMLGLLLAAGGCMMFCPEPSLFRATELGEIKILDYPTCSHLCVLAHEVEINRERRLVVKVRWLNRGKKTYRAEIRARFMDANSLPERGAFRWDLQPFPPGEAAVEWTSYTSDAAHYCIEVRSAR